LVGRRECWSDPVLSRARRSSVGLIEEGALPAQPRRMGQMHPGPLSLQEIDQPIVSVGPALAISNNNATGSFAKWTQLSFSPAALRGAIIERRRCRSIPTYSRSAGTFFCREGVALASPSVPTHGPSRRERLLAGELRIAATSDSCTQRNRATQAGHAEAATRFFIASRPLCHAPGWVPDGRPRPDHRGDLTLPRRGTAVRVRGVPSFCERRLAIRVRAIFSLLPPQVVSPATVRRLALRSANLASLRTQARGGFKSVGRQAHYPTPGRGHREALRSCRMRSGAPTCSPGSGIVPSRRHPFLGGLPSARSRGPRGDRVSAVRPHQPSQLGVRRRKLDTGRMTPRAEAHPCWRC
jgi:hypothetical protein